MTSRTASTPPSPNTFELKDRFSTVFRALLQLRSLRRIPAEDQPTRQRQLENELQRALHRERRALQNLPRHPNYSRVVIGRHGSWTGLICRWEAGASTVIHGHPAFTYYHVVAGSFTMELYRKSLTDHPYLTGLKPMTDGDSIWEYGIEGQYDNFIHRVLAHQPGFSVQLFSEDPVRGDVFNLSKPATHSRCPDAPTRRIDSCRNY